MGFIQENIIELKLGFKNEYKLIHFSDVHAVTYNEYDSNEIIETAKKAEETWYKQRTWFADSAKEHYDQSQMIPSSDCLKNIIKYVNHEKPIGVVMTGDIIDYYSDANYDLLLEQCGNLNYPFVFACGNHETPVNRYEDLTCDEDGFIVLEFYDFKLISLDNSTKKISLNTLHKFIEELNDNKPIIIAMHIPLCTKHNYDEMIKYDAYYLIEENNTDDVTKEFIDICITNDLIKAILCGHVHGHCETEFAPGKLQCCASSGLIGLVNKIVIK